MINFLKNALSRHKRSPARYEAEKALSTAPDAATRLKLARSKKTHPEILYYLAEHDADAAIRKAVAKNPSTPLAATPLISADRDVDVRLALAGRLVKLLPDLSREDYSHLYAVAVQALGTLAMDEVLRVRMALASSLKDHAYAPPAVVSQLARDVERSVSEPILRYCLAVPDDVLIEILSGVPDSWVVQAVANRKTLSTNVTTAIIATNDPAGGAALLRNPGAALSVPLLQTIVERARAIPEWQEPLATRKTLPPDMAKALAAFAVRRVQDILIHRSDFDRQTRRALAQVVERRIGHAQERDTAPARADPRQRVLDLMKQNRLNEKAIGDALALHDHDFVLAALACLTDSNVGEMRRIFNLNAARPIVALAWRAGLPMRLALELQKTLGRVPVRDLIYPRDGSDYPLSEAELQWQVEFLGLNGRQA